MARIWLVCGIAFLAAGAVAAGEADAPITRDQVWRSIFARPPATAIEVPDDRAALGKKLFSDTRLSGDGTHACSSCHQPDRSFTDGLEKGRGRDGAPLPRNTPHLWNLAWAASFYWDGREPTLQSQARVPITSANELNGSFPEIISRLSADQSIAAQFANAFPGSKEITETAILEALAAYERTIISPPTRFDAWVAGDGAALSEAERRGFDIFVGKGGCVSCHGGWRFTDDAFHDIGLAGSDPGRGAIDPAAKGIPAFKTPGLLELASTAPYMHDGSLATLQSVVDHYTGNRIERPSLSPNLVRDLKLDSEEKQALITFLLTLSSESHGHKKNSELPKR